MRVEHLMHGGDDAPVVGQATPMRAVVDVMTRKGLGMACVVDDRGALVGIITDGDLRRHLANGGVLLERIASDVMSRQPATIVRRTLATEALRVLEQRKITSVVVVDEDADEGATDAAPRTTASPPPSSSASPMARVRKSMAWAAFYPRSRPPGPDPHSARIISTAGASVSIHSPGWPPTGSSSRQSTPTSR